MSTLIGRHRFPLQALGLALLVEAALLLIVIAVLLSSPAKPALSQPVPITLLNDEKSPEVAPTPKLPTPPTPKPTPKAKVPPTHSRAAAAPPAPVTPAAIPLPSAQLPDAFSEPASLPALPSPPPVTSGKADASIEYAGKVRAAVQAAVAYPPAAAALRFSGRVRVEFHLRDTVSSQARVIIPSAIGMINRAALQSVQNAQYPVPPSDMRGSDKLYQVWVEFTR